MKKLLAIAFVLLSAQFVANAQIQLTIKKNPGSNCCQQEAWCYSNGYNMSTTADWVISCSNGKSYYFYAFRNLPYWDDPQPVQNYPTPHFFLADSDFPITITLTTYLEMWNTWTGQPHFIPQVTTKTYMTSNDPDIVIVQ